MFSTLEFQQLNELIKSKVADFASPYSFHAVNVECFKAQRIKAFAKFCGKFPLPVEALFCDFTVLSREVPDSTIPVSRTFDFTRNTFVECAKFAQGFFQELRRHNFITIRSREKGFQSEIKASTFTCLDKWFRCVGVITRKAYPIIATPVTLDSDCFNITCPLFFIYIVISLSNGVVALPSGR